MRGDSIESSDDDITSDLTESENNGETIEEE